MNRAEKIKRFHAFEKQMRTATTYTTDDVNRFIELLEKTGKEYRYKYLDKTMKTWQERMNDTVHPLAKEDNVFLINRMACTRTNKKLLMDFIDRAWAEVLDYGP